jgi:hypothetical protein
VEKEILPNESAKKMNSEEVMEIVPEEGGKTLN